MSEPPRPTQEPGTPAAGTDTAAGAMDALRELLLGREQVKLDALERRIVDPTLRVEDVSTVLPQAVSRCVREDGRLAAAMSPAVEESLRASIRRDPSVLTNAIFPIIGPAIRRAVSEAFRRVVQTFSDAMEHSLSWRGLRWRWDAWRTGRPMAEVVLYHTLVYRVEQVFLIHRPSGLLLLHVGVPGVGTGDEDLVAGMLSAVRDFVQDSFSPSPEDELQSVQVGELSVWVEAGPHAILAAAIRGHAPFEMRQRLQGALERVHALDGGALAAFKGGDVSAFEGLRGPLEACLEERRKDETRASVVSWKAMLVVGVVLIGILVWWGAGWRARGNEAALVAKLRAEPGIVLTRAVRAGGRLEVDGLRDLLAADPAVLAAEAGVSTQQVVFRWEPYQSLTPPMVMRRIQARFPVPGGVVATWYDGTLTVAGAAPAAWWQDARVAWSRVAGVERIEAGGLVLSREPTWQEMAQAITVRTLNFGVAKATAEGQDEVLRRVAAEFNQAAARARTEGKRLALRVTGHADRSGADTANDRLSLQRAEWARDRLTEFGVAKDAVEVLGQGSRIPVSAGNSAAPENRRVTFSVETRP